MEQAEETNEIGTFRINDRNSGLGISIHRHDNDLNMEPEFGLGIECWLNLNGQSVENSNSFILSVPQLTELMYMIQTVLEVTVSPD